MSSNVPTVGQVSLFSLVFQLVFIGFLIFLFDLANIDESFIFGAFTYSLIALILRNLISKKHRQGVRLMRQQKFTDAIKYFEESVDFFSNNIWVDKFRFLTLLSSSKMTYKEMGLCNIAFCYGQTSNGQKAKEYYEQVLKEFPKNGVAITGLNMLNSVQNHG